MILIQQNSKLDRTRLSSNLDKYGITEYKFSSESIQDDIDKLTRMEEGANRIKLENINRTKKYLNNILKKANKGKVKVNWTLKGNEITAVPIEIRKIKMFGIQTSDYITLENEAVLSIDYSRLIDMLSFEIAYRDFGFTREDIENKLSDISIVGVYSSDILFDRELIENNTYDITLGMMIDDTPYMSVDKSIKYDYFGNAVETDKFYRGIVENTRGIAMSIIVQDMLSKVSKNNIKVEIAGVYEDSVYLILPDGKDESTAKLLAEPVIARIFGRRFEVQPVVQMY